MLNLYNKKYSREDLKKNIYALKLTDIVKTQTLDTTFIVKYILNPNYQILDEDQEITMDYVLKFQPHIRKELLLIGLKLYNKDDDSIEDFETVSNSTFIKG
jgi:hypothetical protein